MYREYWGLNRAPFAEGLEIGSFYQSPVHEEALARLHFLVEERQRIGLLLGNSGCGKSLLLAVLARQLARRGHQVAAVNLLGADPQDVLWQIANGLGLAPSRSATTFTLWRDLLARLSEHRFQGGSTVLLLDDAEEATPEVATQIVRLIQADTGPQVKLSLVLATIGNRLDRLGQRLLDLADLRIDVEAWEIGDTGDYLSAALEQAGRATPVFAPSAVLRLQELTEGVPRRVKQLAQLALLAGAGRGLPQIDGETVDAVYQELGVVTV
ncbi:MAG TPA: AAA family ATPase [Pirellulales bacterium]|jgi:type II secretory pathway predicted ATPase ExeA|nr:AAA family ATPase [Pirellulales bacterium]